MKLLRNLVVVDIDNTYIIINTINGLVDQINYKTFIMLKKWSRSENIKPENQEELILYNKMKLRGYLFESYEDETKKKNSIISKLKKKDILLKKNKNHITFVLTYGCNFKCSYCFENNMNTEERSIKKVIDFKYIDAALNLVGDSLETITLFGGEPLLSETKGSIEYIISKNLDKKYYVITNGYHLDLYLELLSKVKIEYIMVTLDGNESVHNKRRYLANGAVTYSKIINNIEKCLKNNLNVKIRMNLNEENYDSCLILREELKIRFKKYINLLMFELSPIFGVKQDVKNSIFKNLFEEDAIMNEKNVSKSNHILTKFSPIINSLVLGKKLKPVYSFCSGHNSGIIVDPYGYMYPCITSVGKKELAIGEYYPKEIYYDNSVYFRNIETIQECKECRYSLICGGGCPLSLKDYKDLMLPECSSILNQMHNLLPDLLKEHTNK